MARRRESRHSRHNYQETTPDMPNPGERMLRLAEDDSSDHRFYMTWVLYGERRSVKSRDCRLKTAAECDGWQTGW